MPCRVKRLDDGRLLVRTLDPVSAVTPGQSAVFMSETAWWQAP